MCLVHCDILHCHGNCIKYIMQYGAYMVAMLTKNARCLVSSDKCVLAGGNLGFMLLTNE